MAIILNIETSGSVCSVALTKDGVLETQFEDREGMNHSVKLAPFVEQCLAELERKEEKLDAVAVSIGPGSYTGLRIGLSLAKGLAFSLGVPLIGVNTLKILAVKAMFRNMNWQGDEILVPMIDARRMEVYTAAYDFALNALIDPQAMIVERDSFDSLRGKKVFFLGDGASKTKDVIDLPGAEWIDGVVPLAKDMLALSEKAFREGDFLDIAYSTPAYLKDYQTTVAKNPLLSLGKGH
ncbi:MAG: tRNA (adenosine(37)-N6)-threonylcarbamoyltransferase complex dimerization subunit type 1 TsaB [Muribaculaceae bacterium]|nr:tRNA (adenosine(37)-N6)-threonylcarbamoyltransferase complex dimerization subunit type 1 TsaB [Muribaculaceae bacterium]